MNDTWLGKIRDERAVCRAIEFGLREQEAMQELVTEKGVGAIWMRILAPQAKRSLKELWMWYPFAPPGQGDEEALRRLRADGWVPVEEPQNQRVRSLAGQLRAIRRVLQPGDGGDFADWARADDIAAVDAVPVTLAFSHPEGSLVIPSEIEYIMVAQTYPPPVMGKEAVVWVDGQLSHYSLELLGEQGGAIWQELAEALEALDSGSAAPAWQRARDAASRLARAYWDAHRQQQQAPALRRPRKLPQLRSNFRTKVPSTNSFRALTQSFGPGVQATLWSVVPGGMLELITPNNSHLRVEANTASESVVLHRYVMEQLGPEGLKHMLALLDAYHLQTGGQAAKEDARVSLRQLLIRMGKGQHADDPHEQAKLRDTILYLASTWITSDESRYVNAPRVPPPPLASQRRRRNMQRKEFSPLVVVERQRAGDDGTLQIPSEVVFHLGAEFFETLFGENAQYFLVPTAKLLDYHAVREQQELILAMYLSNHITISGGRFTVSFPVLLLQSALQSKQELLQGDNRTRDAVRVLFALEHLERDGFIIRDAHLQVDSVLTAELALAVRSNAEDTVLEQLAPAAQRRLSGSALYNGMLVQEVRDVKRQRREALQRLLDSSDTPPLAFEAGLLLREQAEKRSRQQQAARERRRKEENRAGIVEGSVVKGHPRKRSAPQ